MLCRAATMAVHSCSMSLCHCNICVRPIIRGASVRSYIGPAIRASRARAQVYIAALCLLHLATAPGCKIDSRPPFSHLSSSRLEAEFPWVVSTSRSFIIFSSVLQCSRLLRGNTKKGHQRSLFEPRRAERTCALHTSDHRCAANNAPLAELLRSRREQLRQNPSSPPA
jgi:hypothetical protein